MTVYTPGGPCLTKTQHDEQVFQKQLQQKYDPSPSRILQNLASGLTANGQQTSTAVQKPATAEDAKPLDSNRALDIRA